MEDVRLDNERCRHWRMFLRKIMEGWAMRNLLYMIRGGISTLTRKIIKGEYYVEVLGYDVNKVLWGVVDDPVVGEGK